jgi:hypothetical protein
VTWLTPSTHTQKETFYRKSEINQKSKMTQDVIRKMQTNQSQIMVANNHPWMGHKTLQKEINHGMYTKHSCQL